MLYHEITRFRVLKSFSVPCTRSKIFQDYIKIKLTKIDWEDFQLDLTGSWCDRQDLVGSKLVGTCSNLLPGTESVLLIFAQLVTIFVSDSWLPYSHELTSWPYPPRLSHILFLYICILMLFSNLLLDLLTPRSWVLLEKPTVAQTRKKFPTFYGTSRFVTMLTRAHHWSLSWMKLIQSTLPILLL
jgi:hypothetical protein